MRYYLASLLLATALGVLGCKDQSSAALASAQDSTAVAVTPSAKPEAPAAAPDDSLALTTLAKEILQTAAAKDYPKLADYVHPIQGIRFSPYAFVDQDDHKHFTAEEFRTQVTKDLQKKVLWGTSDPLSEPIKRTVEAYFKEFGYDKDYLGAGEYGYNQTMGGGTVSNNLEEIYPGAPRVEVFWAPTDEERAPYEWGAVRLVFEKQGDRYYLIAWVHDAWNT
jgi:hypothetical protein